jgi:XTP/dITP diphosphohydrolase
MDLIFATHNSHKLNEIKKLISDDIKLLSLSDLNESDIPETGTTLNENASLKSWYIYNKYKLNCFSDDTGLEIEGLNNEPGIFSARYAGEEKDAVKNMNKVLVKLAGIVNRKARFKTVISFIKEGIEYQFDGIIEGTIIDNPIGNKGFGYDPIFKPNGYSKTFAELDLDVKNKISHRGLAVNKLIEFLDSNMIY